MFLIIIYLDTILLKHVPTSTTVNDAGEIFTYGVVIISVVRILGTIVHPKRVESDRDACIFRRSRIEINRESIEFTPVIKTRYICTYTAWRLGASTCTRERSTYIHPSTRTTKLHETFLKSELVNPLKIRNYVRRRP